LRMGGVLPGRWQVGGSSSKIFCTAQVRLVGVPRSRIWRRRPGEFVNYLSHPAGSGETGTSDGIDIFATPPGVIVSRWKVSAVPMGPVGGRSAGKHSSAAGRRARGPRG